MAKLGSILMSDGIDCMGSLGNLNSNNSIFYARHVIWSYITFISPKLSVVPSKTGNSQGIEYLKTLN